MACSHQHKRFFTYDLYVTPMRKKTADGLYFYSLIIDVGPYEIRLNFSSNSVFSIRIFLDSILNLVIRKHAYVIEIMKFVHFNNKLLRPYKSCFFKKIIFLKFAQIN